MRKGSRAFLGKGDLGFKMDYARWAASQMTAKDRRRAVQYLRSYRLVGVRGECNLKALLRLNNHVMEVFRHEL